MMIQMTYVLHDDYYDTFIDYIIFPIEVFVLFFLLLFLYECSVVYDFE